MPICFSRNLKVAMVAESCWKPWKSLTQSNLPAAGLGPSLSAEIFRSTSKIHPVLTLRFQLLTYLHGDCMSCCSFSQAGWWDCNGGMSTALLNPWLPPKVAAAMVMYSSYQLSHKPSKFIIFMSELQWQGIWLLRAAAALPLPAEAVPMCSREARLEVQWCIQCMHPTGP